MECLSNSQQEQDFDFMTNFTVWVYFDSKKIGYLVDPEQFSKSVLARALLPY